MRRFLLVATVAAVLAGCAAGPYVDPITSLRDNSARQADLMAQSVSEFLKNGGRRADALERGKQAVAQSLKDPDSAKFRNVALKARGADMLVCGEVNGKNSYGGYVGFKRFIAGIDNSYIEDTDRRYPHITNAANFGIGSTCWSDPLPLTDPSAATRS